MENGLTVEDFIASAVEEGVKSAPYVFMSQLEEDLRKDVVIAESGSASEYLQSLISEAEAEVMESEDSEAADEEAEE
jgi:hypothetical protein